MRGTARVVRRLTQKMNTVFKRGPTLSFDNESFLKNPKPIPKTQEPIIEENMKEDLG